MEDSPFNDLPAEVRNHIWDLSIAETEEHLVIGTAESEQPAITRACKQIRGECLLMFYAKNKFCFAMDFSGRRTKKINRGRELLGSITRWVRSLDISIHKLFKGLRISVTHDTRSARTNQPLEARHWKNILNVLAGYDYAKPRLQVEIRYVADQKLTSKKYLRLPGSGLLKKAPSTKTLERWSELPTKEEIERSRQYFKKRGMKGLY